jgi:uncharacterized peroxidase-related enzyme
MSFLKSLPTDAGLLEIFSAFPEAARPLLEYQEVLLRGESPFSAAERELIAAYVSGLNNCNYCRVVHSQTAVALGIPADAVADIFSGPGFEQVRHGTNPSDWRIDVRMCPVLTFVRKLTLSPGEITASDVDAIFAAGWNDRALHDAVAICALLNLMNRLVNGLGVEASDAYMRLAAKGLAKHGYAQRLEFLRVSK